VINHKKKKPQEVDKYQQLEMKLNITIVITAMAMIGLYFKK
jgi:hypothetical protein